MISSHTASHRGALANEVEAQARGTGRDLNLAEFRSADKAGYPRSQPQPVSCMGLNRLTTRTELQCISAQEAEELASRSRQIVT